jgi:hypothetical protein
MSSGRSSYWPLEWTPTVPAVPERTGTTFAVRRYTGTYADWMPSPLRVRRGLDPVFSRSDEALALVSHLARTAAPGVFTSIRNRELCRDLRDRLADPGAIDQGTSRLCGPAAFVYGLATHDPVQYVNFVAGLYLSGAATVGGFSVRAGSDVRRYNPHGRVAPADWIALASIRDSENWFFDYQSDDNAFPGITLPRELAAWFKKVGYQSVINKTSLTHDENEANLREADRLFGERYWVCLLVNASVLDTDTQTDVAMVPDHWIVLRSHIQFGASIHMKVFSWGQGNRPIPASPKTPLSTARFLDYYNGFVAAKF